VPETATANEPTTSKWIGFCNFIFDIVSVLFKFISHSLDGFDDFITKLFAYFPDMDVDGTVAHNYVVGPDTVKYFVASKYSTRF